MSFSRQLLNFAAHMQMMLVLWRFSFLLSFLLRSCSTV